MKRKKAEVDQWDLEELKETLEAVESAMVHIRATGISDRALAVLIQHAAKGRKLTIAQIQDVIYGLDRVREFVFPKNRRR